jgi:hypothetical protein
MCGAAHDAGWCQHLVLFLTCDLGLVSNVHLAHCPSVGMNSPADFAALASFAFMLHWPLIEVIIVL